MLQQPANASLQALCSSKYLGEGMSAALTGLLLGFCLLLCSNVFISESTLQQLLSFDHSSFFTCACLCIPCRVCSAALLQT